MKILDYLYKKSKWACLCIVTLGFTACSLEPELAGSYTDDTLWKNENNVELYLNSFYTLVGQSYYAQAIEEDGYSDILKMSLPYANQNLWAFGTLPVNPAGNIFENWGWGYLWVTQCNRFLDGLYTSGQHLPKAFQNKVEAEVRFFRAHVYFLMARRYGASLIIFRQLPPLGEKNHPLSTPDECWDFIAEDLDFAARNLPERVDKQGKLTKAAALGLKARAMLYAARWKSASDAAKEIIDMNIYDLFPDYAKLFQIRRSDNIENKESILEFGFLKPELAYQFDYSYCPPGDNGASLGNPTENLVSQYQMADGTPFDWSNPAHRANPYAGREPRFYASILYNDAPWKGRRIESYEGGKDGWGYGGNATATGYYLRKFLDEEMIDFKENDYTYYYMRYAEVLLIYAEAIAQQGDLPSALKALNTVRKRAGFTTELTAVTIDDFMTLLRHERMVELAFEGHRFWDLRRWDLAKATLNNVHLDGVKPLKQADGSFSYQLIDCDNGRIRIYLDKYKRFPIPPAELETNALCEQFDEWK